MADNIEKIVLENEDTRVLVEAGVTEALAELGEDIGENLKTLVDLITATAVEYGANSSDISKGHAFLVPKLQLGNAYKNQIK